MVHVLLASLRFQGVHEITQWYLFVGATLTKTISMWENTPNFKAQYFLFLEDFDVSSRSRRHPGGFDKAV